MLTTSGSGPKTAKQRTPHEASIIAGLALLCSLALLCCLILSKASHRRRGVSTKRGVCGVCVLLVVGVGVFFLVGLVPSEKVLSN